MRGSAGVWRSGATGAVRPASGVSSGRGARQPRGAAPPLDLRLAAACQRALLAARGGRRVADVLPARHSGREDAEHERRPRKPPSSFLIARFAASAVRYLKKLSSGS